MRYPLPEAICRTKEPQPAADLASCRLSGTVRLTSSAEKFRYISELEEIGPANRDAYFLISAPGVEMVDTSFAVVSGAVDGGNGRVSRPGRAGQ
jgi:hypothetical protein